VKTLIGVINCHTRPDFQKAIRDTWLPLVPPEVDVKFFLGRGATREPKTDEVFLDCGDTYLDLPEKVQCMLKWAYAHGAEYTMKLDDDCILDAQAWYQGFQRSDFSGWQDPGCRPNEIKTPWGFAYVLSRKAMKLVKDHPLPGKPGSISTHAHGNDEAFFSTILHYNNIFLNNDPRYYLYQGQKPKPVHRPLRAPKREAPTLDMTRYYTAYAWAIYLNWEGWHNTSPEVILQEFRKVFKDRVQEKYHVCV